MKKVIAYVLVAVMALTVVGINPSEASALSHNKIGKIGSSTKTMSIGQERELSVKKGSSVTDADLWWYAANESIVSFDDEDRADDEVEIRGLKAGTTKVYCKNELTGGKIVYTVKVSKPTGKISRIGNKTRTISVGNDFDLAVKLSGLSENDVYWTVGNTSVVGYDDEDRYDNEMEFVAKKAGTTQISAKNLTTGGKIYFTVKVKGSSGITLSRVGNATKYVELGDDLDVSVKKGAALSADEIQWSIEKPSLLRFDETDNIGTAVEVQGLKKGTTKLYAKNLRTGGKIVYTIKVVPDND